MDNLINFVTVVMCVWGLVFTGFGLDMLRKKMDKVTFKVFLALLLLGVSFLVMGCYRAGFI